MEIAAIVELITGVGFPIACVILLGFFIYKLQNESVQREERLMNIIEDYGTKLAETTSTIKAINEKIDRSHMQDNP